MSNFRFTDPSTGRVYSVKAPAGVSFDQAKSIFTQQLDTGALAGFKVGQALNSASQALNGMLSALPNFNQSLSSLANKLPSATNLNTISSALGPAGLASIAQTQTSLLGQSFPAATNAINGLVSSAASLASTASSALTAGASAAASLVTKTGASLSGAAAAASSVASSTIAKISETLQKTPVTNAISVSDIVKQGSQIGLPDLSAVNVQAAMSQVSKSVSQTFSTVTNNAGLGQFGLNLPQLEKAGYLKPGIATAFGSSSLTSVLSSPTVWSGKDGVSGVTDILSNQNLQNNIQEKLMGQGLSELKSVGIPIDKLNAGSVAGLANNAAKSVQDTLSNLKGSLPGSEKFAETMRDAAYAVNLTEDKISTAVLGEVTAIAAKNTVNAETLDAASKRVVGNAKIPKVCA